MSTPIQVRNTTSSVQPAFPHPDRSSLRKMSIRIEMTSQIQAIQMKIRKKLSSQSRSSMTVS